MTDSTSQPPALIRPAVVVLAPDLWVATRFADVIERQGGRAVMTETPDAWVAAVDRTFPVLALVDLDTPGDWQSAIARCKLRPHTRQVPVVAFGSHVDVDALRAARHAGADHAWARSKMMAELPALVARHIAPPIQYLEGWDAPLSASARAGVEAFNRGEYFEQHELFETAWLEEPRPIRVLYQGILQIGVAFLHIQQDNWAGAIKLFRRGLPRLRPLPPICQGIDLAALRSAAEAIHQEVTDLGPARLHEFDQRKFPKIKLSVVSV